MITSTPLLNKEDKKLMNMKHYVRYMVSLRCKTIVSEELKKLGIKYSILPYGAIKFLEEVTQEDLKALKRNLRKSGLDLLDIHESKLVDRIINTIMEVIHDYDELPKLTYSEIIAQNIGEANESVLKIFSEVVGMSVIQFIVIQKVEKIKELLLYDDISLSEITYRLRYKSEQHLIAQFKKVTGLTPSFFKQLRQKRLGNLQDL
ncbi:MAG: helix-turn-helix domain-containing protein [Balneolaceae bacterium]|nr:helix-turn-helix domain-containing protein [Balneolaceae bacterium]